MKLLMPHSQEVSEGGTSECLHGNQSITGNLNNVKKWTRKNLEKGKKE
jgi:hypothetical protein